MSVLCCLFNILVLWGKKQAYYKIPSLEGQRYSKGHLVSDFFESERTHGHTKGGRKQREREP